MKKRILPWILAAIIGGVEVAVAQEVETLPAEPAELARILMQNSSQAALLMAQALQQGVPLEAVLQAVEQAGLSLETVGQAASMAGISLKQVMTAMGRAGVRPSPAQVVRLAQAYREAAKTAQQGQSAYQDIQTLSQTEVGDNQRTLPNDPGIVVQTLDPQASPT